MFSTIPVIAVLITSHNRRDITLKCLNHLYCQNGINNDFTIEVFLVDDGSTDGTKESIRLLYSEANIIQGNGNLFWNRGMNLAWKTATATSDFDYYLWLNDDTFMDPCCLLDILNDYFEALSRSNSDLIITGACRGTIESDNFSYGGRNSNGPIIPNYSLQNCQYINGNIVLVPNSIYLKVGGLNEIYRHSYGDIDYGLRVIKSGFECYTTKKYVATCLPNLGIPDWCNPKLSLTQRWKNFNSPKGLHISDYNRFRKLYWKRLWIIYSIKAHLKMLFPFLYSKLLNNE
jgi:GT2 family glycosyltransferase